MRLRHAIISTACLVLPAIAAGQATYTYIGPDGGSWSDPNNWSPTGVPMGTINGFGADSVSISTSVAMTVVPDYGYSTVELDQLSMSGPITLTAGQQINAYGLKLDGTIVDGEVVNAESQGSTLSNVSVTGGEVLTEGGAIEGDTQVNNFGEIESSGAGNIGISGNVALNNGGIDAENDIYISGTITMSNESGIGGDYVQVSPGTTINIYGGEIGSWSQPSFGAAPSTPTTINLLGPGGIGGSERGTLQFGNTAGGPVSSDLFLDQTDGSIGDTTSDPQATILLCADVSYTLSGGTISGLHFEDNGPTNQTGGSVFGDYSLTIAGIYNFSGGSVGSTDSETISGTLTQTGGTNSADLGAPEGLSITTTGVYTLAGGTLQANPFSNAGTFIIDAKYVQSSQMVVTSFEQDSTGTLDFLDLTPSNIPILVISKFFDQPLDITLDGKLEIAFDPSYTPAFGDVFALLQAQSLTGTFAAYSFPTLPDGLYFEPIYTATSFSLEIVPEPTAIMVLAGLSWLAGLRRRAGR